jgi:glutamate-1-semialdehyde 2,1-aminomutase
MSTEAGKRDPDDRDREDDERRFRSSRAWQERAHRVIPGGSHTYAKGDDQYPRLAPGFIDRGHGCHVWDVDGNEFIEYNMGGRAVVLGHGHEPVVAAAYRAMAAGTSFVRPHRLEVECAERFLETVPRADMVKFTKDGSTATTAAIKLARAFTGRDRVALCADHPFFSYDDWFIGTTEMAAGIPGWVREASLTFRYNDLEDCRRLFAEQGERIAAVILEPVRNDPPADDFLHRLRDLAHEHGAVFILDEMITGFRYHRGGGQALFDITPDLSTFGKGLANGFSLSALCGRREIMRLGGLDHAEERVFLLSTTHGGETHALAAGMEVMRIFRDEDVVGHMERVGERLRRGCEQVIAGHGLEAHVSILGYPANLAFATRDPEGRPSQGYRSLFLQELIRNGILAPALTVSYAHTEDDIDRTVDAFDRALPVYRRALEDGFEAHLVGRPSRVVYRRYN